MAHSDSLKDWLARNPDAKIVDAGAGDYDTQYATGEESGWADSIAHSGKEFFEEGTEYIKQGTGYASERLKLAKEAADKYTKLAFKNLRRSVLETIMSDGGKNSASRKVRRQAIAAVLGEESWKNVESQYDIVGSAWGNAEAVTRALGALELAESSTSHSEWDAWAQISPSSPAAFLEIPQRILWLEHQGYITHRTGSLNEPGYLPMIVAWVYFGFLIILAFWALKWFQEVWVWSWNRIRYGEILEEFEETPPKKRRRQIVKKPTRDIKRLKQYNFEYVKIENGVKDEFVPKSKTSAIVVHNSSQGNEEAKPDPNPLSYHADDSQYTEDENQAQNSYYINEGENDPEAKEEYYNKEGYEYEEEEESYGPGGQLEAETAPPQQLVPNQKSNSASSYESSANAEDTETENYITQGEEYEEGGSVYDDANEEDGGYEDGEEYSILEEDAPEAPTTQLEATAVQQPQQYHSKVPVAKAGPSSKAPGNAATRPLSKASRAQQIAPPRKRR